MNKGLNASRRQRGCEPSKEFREWFDRVTAEFAAIPFPLFDAAVMEAHSRAQLEGGTIREPRVDLAPEDRTSLFQTQT
jgi:hypothetical protein